MTMKTSLRIALTSALGLIVAACTVTVGPSDDEEPRRPWGPGGSGGSGGAGGSGGSDELDAGPDDDGGETDAETDAGTGGSGGGSGEQCVASSQAGECELCAFDQCEAELCACKADSGCAAALAATDYFDCLEAADGDPDATVDCDLTFFLEATAYDDASADYANDLGMCLHGNMADETRVGCTLECG